MESTGALMVSGEWGCGKTYHTGERSNACLAKERMEPCEGVTIWY